MPYHPRPSRNRHRWQKAMAWLTLTIFSIQPVLVSAQAVADPNAGQNRPTVESTANGTPIVQITAPSAAGVSRNHYSQFNVDAQGLILNNATIRTETQLAGYVDVNANLGGTAARVILNEVTSSNPSYLRGYTEVAGQQAEVIIANPNGIYGDGFGFINTSRATLTTGTPIFGGTGSLEAFRVTGGQISIAGQGLEASNIDRVDLISRAATVNAGIWAKELNVVTGANKVDYATLATEKITGDGTQPQVSLDVSALGGMYAHKICLVGTEQGVGVNSQGIISATGGDLIMTNEGKITLAETASATGNITITTTAALENSDTITAGQNTTITAQRVSSTGTIGAGIVDEEIVANGGDLTITATDTVTTTGQQLAGGSIAITGAAIDLSGGTTYADGSASLSATQGDVNHSGATTQVGGTLTINAAGTVTNDQDANDNAGQLIAGQIAITAGAISNKGGSIQHTAADAATLTATHSIDNSGGTIITNGAALTIHTGALLNSQGQIQHTGTGMLIVQAANDLQNDGGAITTNGQASLTAHSIDNTQGTLTAQQQFSINTTELFNNKGTITGGDVLTLTAQGAFINQQGSVRANNELLLTAQSLDNHSGTIRNLGTNSTTLSVDQYIDNQNGLISGTGSADITAQRLTNQNGQVQAQGRLTITAAQGTDNTGGTLTAGQDLSLNQNSADLLNDSGTISADGNLTVQAAAISNDSGTLTADQTIALTGHSLSNSGEASAGQDLTMTLTGDVTNTSGAQLKAQRDLTLNAAGTVTNSGSILAVRDASLNAGQVTNAAGATAVAGNTFAITTSGNYINEGILEGTLVTINGQTVNPGSLEIIADASAAGQYKPIVDTAANGVDLIQIASASAAGVSRNQYTQFNIDPRGLILNNATQHTQTQLGGYIDGNWRLGTTPARIILNEVTGANISKLLGYLEVAGQQAEVIIANQNGIVGSGTGFINTSRSILTTGTPVFDGSGSLAAFRVTGGHITIQGAGLAAGTTDQTDLISRSTALNAGLWASDLNVITGTNTVDHTTLQTHTLTAGANQPATAIDVGELGGMYANKIQLVSTEQGVGVVSRGTLSADAGDFLLDSNGKVTLSGTTGAAGNITMTVADSLTNQGTLFSQGDTSLYVRDNVENLDGAAIYSLGDITIAGSPDQDAAASVLNQSATIDAGGNLAINADQITNKKGEFTTGWTVSTQNYSHNITPLADSGDKKYYNAIRKYKEVTEIGGVTSESEAAQLLAGNNILLQGTTIDNQFSTIAAGGDLTIQSENLYNLGYQNTKIVTATGTDTHYWKIRHHKKWHHRCWTEYGTTNVPYYKQTVVNIDGTRPGIISANNNLSITGNISNKTIDAAGNILTAGNEITPGATVDNPGKLPGSGLFTVHPAAGQYLVETNPQFTGYQNFLSSDYLLERLSYDPELVTKRLGDGFYEQQLIREQITQLTGQRFLDGYTSDEDQFKALMDNGLAYAQEFNITVGVALNAEQMAKLTTDMVWLVEQEVAGQKVLVPVVYASKQHLDLTPQGALMIGGIVTITAVDDITNSAGTIKADDQLQLTADTITNQHGSLNGATVQITAAQDIVNQNGTISGDQIELTAGRDIINETTTTTVQHSTLTQTQAAESQAGIIAQEDLTMQAGRDVSISGADLAAGGDITIAAGRNLEISAVEETTHVTNEPPTATTEKTLFRNVQDSPNSRMEGQTTTHVVSTLQAGGNITLTAQNDATLQGAQVAAGNDLNLAADGDVTITAVKDRAMQDVEVGRKDSDVYSRTKTDDETVIGSSLSASGNVTITAGQGSNDPDTGNVTLAGSGVFSESGKITVDATNDVTVQEVSERHETYQETKETDIDGLATTTTVTRDHTIANYAIGSALSGEQLQIKSGNDLTLQGSQVIGTNDVALSAGNDVTITTAQETYDAENYYYQKTSGLSISFSGGLNVFAGTTKENSTTTEHTVSQVGSTVGSTAGNVTITAGNDATITGSDVIGQEGIDVTAQNITIDAATNTSDIHQTYEFKQTGLTISIGNTFTEKAGEAASAYERSQAVANDRLEALYDLKAYRAADKAVDAVKDNRAVTGLTMTVGFGSTKQESETNTHITSAVGSSLSSGGTINLTATGSGTTATDGDLNIIGSSVSGENVTLAAANDINLQSSADTMDSHTESSGKSVGIGVTTGIGKGTAGTSTYIEGSKSSGVIDETSTTYNETTITANNTLTIKSGRDTNLEGAQASGETVIADVGRDLNIISQQDTQTYHEENKSASAKVGTGGSTASANKGKIDSTYQSVNEQSGIFAGTGGFDIEVEGNTDLKGAVIASEAGEEKNRLSTGSLTYSDLENTAEYEADSKGISVNTNPDAEYNEQGITPDIGVPASGDANSTTKSAISLGTIDVRNNPNMDLSKLSRDTENAVNALDQIFDKKTVQEQQELSKMFGEEAFKLVHKISEKNGWKSDSPEKIALHAFVGAVMADMGGGDALSGAVGAGVNEAVQKELKERFKDNPDLHQWASFIIGAAAAEIVDGDAQTGGSTAASGTKNNELFWDKPEVQFKFAGSEQSAKGLADGLIQAGVEAKDAAEALKNLSAQDIASGIWVMINDPAIAAKYGEAFVQGLKQDFQSRVANLKGDEYESSKEIGRLLGEYLTGKTVIKGASKGAELLKDLAKVSRAEAAAKVAAKGPGSKAGGNYLNEPAAQNGTLNIGARGKPSEGAYNIDIDPKAPGVNYGDATNLSNIKTGSQSKIVIENPYGYDPLNPEVVRVLSQDGEIVITGSRSNLNKMIKTLDEKGLTIKERREIINDGSYKTTDGQNIKSEKLDQYVIVRK